MSFIRQVSRALDEEHRSSLDLLGRVEQALARKGRGVPNDPELARLIGAFAGHIAHDIERHFGFEENELFPRMADAGDGWMAALLYEEHEAIRMVAEELLPLARAAEAGTLDATGWDQFRDGSLEMVERQVAHIQKETMALLPLLDDLLDEETDRELAFAYAGD